MKKSVLFFFLLGIFFLFVPKLTFAANCDPNGGIDPSTWAPIEACTSDPGSSGNFGQEWACFGDDGKLKAKSDGTAAIKFSCDSPDPTCKDSCNYNPSNPQPLQPPPPPEPICTFYSYCDAGEGPNSGRQICTGHLHDNGAQCLKDESIACSTCELINKTRIYVDSPPDSDDPNAISQLHKVTVYATGLRECTTNVKLDTGGGLLKDDESSSCMLQTDISAKCSDNRSDHPHNDIRPCWWTYQCESGKDWGNFVARFSTDNQSCNSAVSYTIKQAEACRVFDPANPPRKTPINSKAIVAPSLNDNKTQADKSLAYLLPPEVKQDLDSNQVKDIKTGVNQRFFLQSLLETLCGLQVFHNFGFIKTYCPKNVDFANASTDYFAKESNELALSERPPELKPSPVPQDCNIEDVNDHIAQPPLETKGNKEIDQIQTSIGGDQGFNTLTGKNFDTNDMPYDNKNDNDLSLQGVIFDKEQRDKETNRSCKVYSQENYPNSDITPCHDDGKF